MDEAGTMGQRITVEKRDASGRLLAVVGMAGGLLDGPCRFYAGDGVTVVSEAVFSAGIPLPADAPSLLPALPPGPAGEPSF